MFSGYVRTSTTHSSALTPSEGREQGNFSGLVVKVALAAIAMVASSFLFPLEAACCFAIGTLIVCVITSFRDCDWKLCETWTEVIGTSPGRKPQEREEVNRQPAQKVLSQTRPQPRQPDSLDRRPQEREEVNREGIKISRFALGVRCKKEREEVSV